MQGTYPERVDDFFVPRHIYTW